MGALVGSACGSSEDGSAPTVLSFTSNAATLTAGESVTFSAIVTDPDGIADVIGGSLLSGDRAATYGTFSTAAQEGAYALTLSWDDINRTVPIEFEVDDARVFVARFFDQAGGTVETMLTVKLGCKGEAACGGKCVNTKSDPSHCGTCANRCSSNANECSAGKCRGTVCTSQAFGIPSDCAAACAGAGLSCSTCVGTSVVGEGHNSNACSDYLPGPTPAPDIGSCSAPLAGAITTSMQSVSCCCAGS